MFPKPIAHLNACCVLLGAGGVSVGIYIYLELECDWGRIRETRVLFNLFVDDDAVEHFVVWPCFMYKYYTG